MAVQVASVAQGAEDIGNPNPLTMNAPSGVQDGDLLLFFIANASGGIGSIVFPSGLTTIDSDGAAHASLRYKIASSEPSTYSFSGPASRTTVTILRVIGFLSSNPIDVHSNKTNAASATATGTAITPTNANSGIFFFVGHQGGTNVSGYTCPNSPPSFTEEVDTAGYGGVTSGQAIADGTRVATTSLGAPTATLGVAKDNWVIMLAVNDGSQTLTAVTGAFVLTGIDVILTLAYKLIVSVGTFALTGYAAFTARVSTAWTAATKVATTWINTPKP